MGISAVYGAVCVIALLLLAVWYRVDKKKNIWLCLLFLSVLICNVGYLILSLSKTLTVALWGNRIAYLGNVFLPFLMLMMILNLCKVRVPKWLPFTLLAVSTVVLLVTLTPGILPIYYKSVDLMFADGTAVLVKEYGPLHSYYGLYLILYLAGMIAAILYSLIRKTALSQKHSVFLAVVVLGNIAIWFVQKFITVHFEFLAVSYVMTESLILLLYSIVQEYDMTVAEATAVAPTATVPAATVPEQTPTAEDLPDAATCVLERIRPVEPLTSREMEILRLILEDTRRRDIAGKLGISENTVKTHTSHIFDKLGVSGRSELLEMIDR